ncbi:MAG: hypothetical protein KJ697_01985 [Nanoarchaeota archaeon]|nr:hypothetical protein [Nanoarchaeota archaeon]MBU4124456.1 hypothetical protein [Nanoarchaeota archaeon]
MKINNKSKFYIGLLLIAVFLVAVYPLISDVGQFTKPGPTLPYCAIDLALELIPNPASPNSDITANLIGVSGQCGSPLIYYVSNTYLDANGTLQDILCNATYGSSCTFTGLSYNKTIHSYLYVGEDADISNLLSNTSTILIVSAETNYPDLIIESISLNQTKVETTAKGVAYVKNIGNISAYNFTVIVNDTIENKKLTWPMILQLDPGISNAVHFNWTPAQSGNHIIRATADYYSNISEINKTNNIKEITRFACELNETKCSDNIDNDCDELIDSNDPDCKQCVDSDGGKDYYIKGYTNSSNYIHWDYCSPWVVGEVIETFCVGDTNSSEVYICPYGCSDGACKSCTIKLTKKSNTSTTMILNWSSNCQGIDFYRLNYRINSTDAWKWFNDFLPNVSEVSTNYTNKEWRAIATDGTSTKLHGVENATALAISDTLVIIKSSSGTQPLSETTPIVTSTTTSIETAQSSIWTSIVNFFSRLFGGLR